MKSSFIFFLLICTTLQLLMILDSFDSVLGQAKKKSRRPKRPGYRIRKLKKGQEEGTRLQCLSCKRDFSDGDLNVKDSCVDPRAVSMEKVKTELLTLCSPEVTFCRVEIYRISGVFAGITRACGSDPFCFEGCMHRGYGLDSETCVFCCPGAYTNETIYDPEDEDYPAYADKYLINSLVMYSFCLKLPSRIYQQSCLNPPTAGGIGASGSSAALFEEENSDDNEVIPKEEKKKAIPTPAAPEADYENLSDEESIREEENLNPSGKMMLSQKSSAAHHSKLQAPCSRTSSSASNPILSTSSKHYSILLMMTSILVRIRYASLSL